MNSGIKKNDLHRKPDARKCGCSSAVEHRLPKPRVAGSNPVARSCLNSIFSLSKNFIYSKCTNV